MTTVLLFSIATFQFITEPQDYVDELSAYVDNEVVKKLNKRVKNRVRKYIWAVAFISKQFSMDPLLVAVTITLESGWNHKAVSRVKAIGLMQVKSRPAKKKYNLKDPFQQIFAGVDFLEECIEECGSIPLALNKYAVGQCDTHWSRQRYQMRKYKEAKRKYRGK